VHWKENGDHIRSYRAQRGQSASLPGEQFYRKAGVTYSYIGTKTFRARLLSPDSIFDIASSSLFSDTWDCNYLVGWLNSALIRFLLGVLNPTINFQIGDIRRLPFAPPDAETLHKVCQASETAIKLAQEIEQIDPDSPAFAGMTSSISRLQKINDIEKHCQSTIDDAIFDLYMIPDSLKPTIFADPWVARGSENLCDVEAVIRKLGRIDLGRLEKQLK
jgi:Fe-S-cluster formation regulator IscX/YfhJ